MAVVGGGGLRDGEADATHRSTAPPPPSSEHPDPGKETWTKTNGVTRTTPPLARDPRGGPWQVWVSVPGDRPNPGSIIHSRRRITVGADADRRTGQPGQRRRLTSHFTSAFVKRLESLGASCVLSEPMPDCPGPAAEAWRQRVECVVRQCVAVVALVPPAERDAETVPEGGVPSVVYAGCRQELSFAKRWSVRAFAVETASPEGSAGAVGSFPPVSLGAAAVGVTLLECAGDDGAGRDDDSDSSPTAIRARRAATALSDILLGDVDAIVADLADEPIRDLTSAIAAGDLVSVLRALRGVPPFVASPEDPAPRPIDPEGSTPKDAKRGNQKRRAPPLARPLAATCGDLLASAARVGHAGVVRELLRVLRGRAVLDAPPTGIEPTPLCIAAGCGHLGAVAAFLRAGAEATARSGPDGFSPLGAAARAGSPAVVDALLDAGADADDRVSTRGVDNALAVAVASEQYAVVAALTARGATLPTGSPALGLARAAGEDRVDRVRRLLEAGVPVNHADDGVPGTPLLRAVTRGARRATQALLECGAVDEGNAVDGGGRGGGEGGSVVHAAAGSPDAACAAMVFAAVKRLAHDQEGARPLDARDAAGRTPLEIAALRWTKTKTKTKASSDPMEGLDESGDGTSASGHAWEDEDGDAGLEWATRARIVAALLDAGASPNVAFSNGVLPLCHAVAAGAVDLVGALLERGAHPDGEPRGHPRGGSPTPLLLAVLAGRPDAVDLLVRHGADVEADGACGGAGMENDWTETTTDDLGVRLGIYRATSVRSVRGDTPPDDRTTGEDGGVQIFRRARKWGDVAGNRTCAPGTDRNGLAGPVRAMTMRPLQLAASLGELQCAAALLARGADVLAPLDAPPLVCAAAGGHAMVLSLLLRHGVDPLARTTFNTRGTTALHAAASRGHLEAMRVLLDAVEEIEEDERAADRATSAAAACCVGLNPVQMLAEMFARGGPRSIAHPSSDRSEAPGDRSRSAETSPGRAPASSHATWTSNANATLRYRTDRPFPAGSLHGLFAGRTPRGDVSVNARRLVDVPDDDGQTALYAAAAEGRSEAAALLMDAGARSDAVFPPDGVTLLHVAAAFDHVAVIDALLDRPDQPRVSVNARDALGRTPLYVAAAAGASAAAERLMAAGADCNAAPDRPSSCPPGRGKGNAHNTHTPIVVAAKRGDMRTVQGMVLRGAAAAGAEALGAPLLPTPRRFRREAATLVGHTASVTAVAFHPTDSAICATVGEDGALRVHHETPGCHGITWELGVRFRCHSAGEGLGGGATHLAWSAEGSSVATVGGDGRCCLWTLPKTSPAPALVMECGAPVVCVCWTPDDRRLLAAADSALLVFDPVTGDQIGAIRRWVGDGQYTDGAKGEKVVRCAHGRHRPLAATTSANGAVSLWDSETGRCLTRMFGHGEEGATSAPRGCHLTPDDRYLTTCDDGGGVRVWDINNQSCVASWSAHAAGGATHCCFAPDGTWVATSSGDGTCRVWDPRSGRELSRLRNAANAGFSTCAFSPSGAVLAGGTFSTAEERLRSRGFNVAVLWDGDYGVDY